MTFDGVLDSLISIFSECVNFFLSFLPVSPFDTYMDYVEELPYLGYINWFCPIGTCAQIMSAWLLCIGAYYLISIGLRTFRVIT